MKLNSFNSRLLSGLLILFVMVIFSLSTEVWAEGEATQDSQSEAQATDVETPAKTPVHPVMAEIMQLMETQDFQLTELKAALTETEEIHEIIRIQREIESVKMMTEVEMFRIQIRHAEKEGHTEIVDFLQHTVDGILSRLEAEKERRAKLENSKQ